MVNTINTYFNGMQKDPTFEYLKECYFVKNYECFDDLSPGDRENIIGYMLVDISFDQFEVLLGNYSSERISLFQSFFSGYIDPAVFREKLIKSIGEYYETAINNMFDYIKRRSELYGEKHSLSLYDEFEGNIDDYIKWNDDAA